MTHQLHAPLQRYSAVLLLVLGEWCLLAALGWAAWPSLMAPAALGAFFALWRGSRDPELAGVLLSSLTAAGLLLIDAEHPSTVLGVLVAVAALPRSRRLRAVQTLGLGLVWWALQPPFSSFEHALLPIALLMAAMLPLSAPPPTSERTDAPAPAPATQPARARAARMALLEESARGLSGILDPLLTRALGLVQSDPGAARIELLELRQTLADLRQLSAPSPVAERVQRDLGHVFSTATLLNRTLAPHGANMRVSPPPAAVVFLDEQRLRQTLAPLLTTSWASAGERGTVVLSADATLVEARLYLDDDGPGLPVSDPEELFDPLWSPTPDQASLGLGLALARAAAAAMGATLRAGSSPLGGARFTLVLPLAPKGATRSLPPPPARERTVYMLGLDPALERALARVLGRDWRQVEAPDGQAPAVVVCDLTLDTAHHQERLKQLARIWPGVLLHTVVLADAALMERAGPHSGLLLKPVDADEVREALERARAGYDTPIQLLT